MKRTVIVLTSAVLITASLFLFVPKRVERRPESVTLRTLGSSTVYESFACAGTAVRPDIQTVYLGRPAEITEICVAPGEAVQRGQLLLSCRYLEGEELLERSSGIFYAEAAARIKKIKDQLEGEAILAAAAAWQSEGELPDYLKNYYLPKESSPVLSEDIYADADGIVGEIYVSEGDSVSGMFAAMTIKERDVIIRANIPQRYISKTALGQPVNISGDSLGTSVAAGRIVKIETSAIQVGGLISEGETVIPCFVSFDNSSGLVRENYTVKARFFCREFINAVVIPYEAIMQDSNKKEYIYLFDGGILKKRYVDSIFENETGIVTDGQVRAGETVVLCPSADYFDGMPAEGRSE